MTGERTFGELLAFIHDLEELVIEARAALRRGELHFATAVFAEFGEALRVHLLEEFTVVFELYQRRAKERGAGALQDYVAEHVELVRCAQSVRRALAPQGESETRDLAEIDRRLAVLEDAIGVHAARRKVLLYPALDSAMTAAERKAALARCSIRAGWPPDAVLGEMPDA